MMGEVKRWLAKTGQRVSLRAKLRKFRARVERDFPVHRLILFGSRARGRAKPHSDVDLLVVSPSFRGLDSVERGARMYGYWDLDYPVDFLCYSPEEFRRLRRRITLVREAAENGTELKSPERKK
jgi:predicted nucleotidyltransferase